MHDRDSLPFIRADDDDAWDDRLPCERGFDCDDPLCPSKMNRDAMRIALGSLVECMELIATVQVLSQDYWGGCSDRECTFEGQMQESFSLAGKGVSTAFVHLLDGISMWKNLPADWPADEREAAVRAVRMLKRLNAEALRQVVARAAGSPDPRRADPPTRVN
jgi:hypothetical protein